MGKCKTFYSNFSNITLAKLSIIAIYKNSYSKIDTFLY